MNQNQLRDDTEPRSVDQQQACSAFVWEGDLTDDCTCRHGEYLAHVELMDSGIMCWQQDEDGARESWVEEFWWFAVYRKNESIFNSSDAGGKISTGQLARALAEAIMS